MPNSRWSRRPNDDPAIHYLDIFGEGAHTQPLTPFRGYFIADLMSAQFRVLAAHCPASVFDLLDHPDRRLINRAHGLIQLRFEAVEMDVALGYLRAYDPQFVVCRYPVQLAKHIDELERLHGWPVRRLPYGSMEFPPLQPHERFTPTLREVVMDYVREVCQLIATIDPVNPLILPVKNKTMTWREQPSPQRFARMHGAAYPSEALLSVAGLRFGTPDQVTPNAPDHAVHDWLTDLARDALDCRRAAAERADESVGFDNDLILFFPNYYLEMYLPSEDAATWMSTRHARESQLLRLLDPSLVESVCEQSWVPDEDLYSTPEMEQFCDILVGQDSFLFTVPDIDPYRSLVKTEEGQQYMSVAKAEVVAATAAVSLLATNTAAPVLRFSPGLARSFPALFEFVETYQACENGLPVLPVRQLPGPDRHPDQDTVASAYNAFVEAAAGWVPTGYRSLVTESFCLKSVSDFPFEWLRFDTLPLGATKEFSRLPHTPGQFLTNVVHQASFAVLEAKDMAEIRVVTSFEDSDPLRGAFCRQLEDSFDLLRSESGWTALPKLQEVRVSTPAEFVEALADAPGKILVVDMHGGAQSGVGSPLYIGGLPFSSVELEVALRRAWLNDQRLIRTPPIVILSACDTLNPRSNSFSMASTLLQTGTIAVIGTLMPIDAERSGFFIGKLLIETMRFLADPFTSPQTWRNMVADQLCFSAMVDWFGAGLQLFPRTFADSKDYAQSASRVTRSRAGPPLQLESRLIKAVAAELHADESDLRHAMITRSPFVDAMNYVQLGFPERILLKPAGLSPHHEGPSPHERRSDHH